MKQPRLLDLFSGAGGCTKGYQRAGFWVRGVDIKPQPRYRGEEFVQADALEYLARLIELGETDEFDAIHASPPCQDYTPMRFVTKKRYPRLLDATRELLIEAGLPYVIENVDGAPLVDQPLWGTHVIVLCGNSFDLCVYRHRRFESSVDLVEPPHRAHQIRCAPQGRPVEFDGQFVTVTGHCSGVGYARRAMGIDWMVGSELSQAIPPHYTEYIGKQLLAYIQAKDMLENTR
jgi:DNA (cytosine-5)-methyltransferase 1